MGAVSDAAVTYVETLAGMAELEGDRGFLAARPRQWNRLVDRLQSARKDLASSAVGRAVISDLVTDSRATVRLWAAGHALFWDEARARAVLEEMSQNARQYGLHATSARMTLREFDAGRLDPNW